MTGSYNERGGNALARSREAQSFSPRDRPPRRRLPRAADALSAHRSHRHRHDFRAHGRAHRADRRARGRAAQALQAATGTPLGANLALRKRIPQGGGLGGGSSDAATVLLALNELWGCGLSIPELTALGLGLGADVPVFVQG